MKKIRLLILVVMVISGLGIAYGWSNIPGSPSFLVWEVDGHEATDPIVLLRGHSPDIYIETVAYSILQEFKIEAEIEVMGITINVPLIDQNSYNYLLDPWYTYDYGDVIRLRFPFPVWDLPFSEGKLIVTLKDEDGTIAAGQVSFILEDYND